MRILLVNERLAKRTGTELAAWETGRALARRGYAVTLAALELGRLAQEIADEGIVSVAPLFSVPDRPDVIHLNQLTPHAEVVARFPGIPILLQWHTYVSSRFRIPDDGSISVVCGVTPTINREIALSTGRTPDALLGNFVDLSRFALRGKPLPDVPRNWLLVGQQRGSRRLLPTVLRAAMNRRARLRLVGPRFFKRIPNFPAYAAECDLVIASGRCALESLAAGAGLIVGDSRGVGDFVTSENVKRYRTGNFSFSTFDQPMTYSSLLAAVDRYDPIAGSAASSWLRQDAGLEQGIVQFEQLYRLAIDRTQARDRALCERRDDVAS